MYKSGIVKKYKFLLFLLFSTLLCGCNEPKTVNGIYFDTFISITAYDNTSQEVLDNCINMCSDYELVFSKTNPSSELYAINSRDNSINISSTPGEFCAIISEDLYSLIEYSLSLANNTNLAFNPALGQVISLWDYKSENPVIPSDYTVKESLLHTNINSIHLDKDTKTITITDPALQIDLGGIAKGYVSDKLKNYLIESGTKNAIISLAGNIYCIGDKYGQKYNVGIQKPFSDKKESLLTLSVYDTSVVTSGVYERYFKSNGIIYHHIIDPHSGYPSTSDLISVTIICNNSTQADALSTAILVMGKEKGIEYLDSLENVSAILIDSSNNIIKVGDFFN